MVWVSRGMLVGWEASNAIKVEEISKWLPHIQQAEGQEKGHHQHFCTWRNLLQIPTGLANMLKVVGKSSCIG